jgi:hypothetical protein
LNVDEEQAAVGQGFRRLWRDWSYTFSTTLMGLVLALVALIERAYRLAGLCGAATAFGALTLWRRWRHPEIRPRSERINRR